MTTGDESLLVRGERPVELNPFSELRRDLDQRSSELEAEIDQLARLRRRHAHPAEQKPQESHG